MAIDPRSLLKRDSATLSGDALMLARPEVLRGVDAGQQTALEALQIRTVFDLAASAAFGAARRVLRLQDDATLPEAQLQRVAADIADAPAGVPVAELALQPIQALRAIDAQHRPRCCTLHWPPPPSATWPCGRRTAPRARCWPTSWSATIRCPWATLAHRPNCCRRTAPSPPSVCCTGSC